MAGTDDLSRRRFLRAGGAAAGAAVILGNTPPAYPDGAGPNAGLPQRVLGKTGVKVPILGLGTVAVGNVEDAKEARSLIHRAIDLGVTYLDTAPARTSLARDTGYGHAQGYLRDVLRDRREDVFVVTKCLETDGEKALALLKQNLKELGIEQVDLVYTHTIGHAVYEFDALVGDRGPMAALERARKDGLTRFVGVSGHNRPEKFARVIEAREVDVMMNAVNVVDRHTYAFEEVVWPSARKKNIGLAAMKVYGGGVTGCKMPAPLLEASFRFAQSVAGVSLAVIGMANRRELEQNVRWARTYEPMTLAEANALKARTVALARQWGAHLDRFDGKGEASRPLINT
jgi:aryl-alcohol dehydrogenase-like predicted oxidoreductase